MKTLYSLALLLLLGCASQSSQEPAVATTPDQVQLGLSMDETLATSTSGREQAFRAMVDTAIAQDQDLGLLSLLWYEAQVVKQLPTGARLIPARDGASVPELWVQTRRQYLVNHVKRYWDDHRQRRLTIEDHELLTDFDVPWAPKLSQCLSDYAWQPGMPEGHFYVDRGDTTSFH